MPFLFGFENEGLDVGLLLGVMLAVLSVLVIPELLNVELALVVELLSGPTDVDTEDEVDEVSEVV